MKRSALVVMGIVVVLVVVLAAGTIPAQGKILPDLKVKSITLTKDCQIKVTLKNVGNGVIPASIYSGDHPISIVQMYKDNQPHGGMMLRSFDPKGLLRMPGGVASKVWFPNTPNLAFGSGTHVIEVVVDKDNAITESREYNNSLTRRLTCNPDLIVSNIELTGDCWVKVTLKNIGGGGVPDSAYWGNPSDDADMQLYKASKIKPYGNIYGAMLPFGGANLNIFDPSGLLRTPGASVSNVCFPRMTTMQLSPGAYLIKVVVDSNNEIVESNENNNSRQKKLICK